jgi:hypothetical protein
MPQTIKRPSDTSSVSPRADQTEYVVWYGTNRRSNDSGDAGKGYSAARDNAVHYGLCRVFIQGLVGEGSTIGAWKNIAQPSGLPIVTDLTQKRCGKPS